MISFFFLYVLSKQQTQIKTSFYFFSKKTYVSIRFQFYVVGGNLSKWLSHENAKWYWNYLVMLQRGFSVMLSTQILSICSQHFANTVLRSPENGCAVILRAMLGCIWSV